MNEENKGEEVVAEESEENVAPNVEEDVATTVEVSEEPTNVEVEANTGAITENPEEISLKELKELKELEELNPVENVAPNFDFTPIVDAINKNASTSTSTTIEVGEDKLTVLHEVTTGDLLIGTLIAANIIVALVSRIVR